MSQLQKTRENLLLSQRKLAKKANLSLRTLQEMEKSFTQSKLSTIGQVLHALGHHPSVLTQFVHLSLIEKKDSVFFLSLNLYNEPENWKMYFFQWLDLYYSHPSSEMLKTAPVNIEEKLMALLASTCELLATRFNHSIPYWTMGIAPLKSPWFISEMQYLKTFALVESFPEFKKRNIYVLENFLTRV